MLCTDAAHQKHESGPSTAFLSPNVDISLHTHFLFAYHLELLNLKMQTPPLMLYIALSTMIRVQLALVGHAYSTMYVHGNVKTDRSRET